MTITEALTIYTKAVQGYGQLVGLIPFPEDTLQALERLYTLARRARVVAEDLARLSGAESEQAAAWQGQKAVWYEREQRWDALRTKKK